MLTVTVGAVTQRDKRHRQLPRAANSSLISKAGLDSGDNLQLGIKFRQPLWGAAFRCAHYGTLGIQLEGRRVGVTVQILNVPWRPMYSRLSPQLGAVWEESSGGGGKAIGRVPLKGIMDLSFSFLLPGHKASDLVLPCAPAMMCHLPTGPKANGSMEPSISWTNTTLSSFIS